MSTINLEALDNIDKQFDAILDYLDNACADIEKTINSAGEKAQPIIDKQMDKLGQKITKKVQPIRDNIVRSFRGQYQEATKKIEPIKPLLNISISLDTVVDVVMSIVKIITAPYQPIIEFLSLVIPKVLKLSEKMMKIVNYKPNIHPQDPNITIPTPKIDIQPITAKDITG